MILQDLGNMVFLAVFCIGFIDFMLQGKSLQNLHDILRTETDDLSVLKKMIR